MKISRYPRGLMDPDKMVEVENRDLVPHIEPWTGAIAFIDLNVTMERNAERQSQIAITLSEADVVALYEALVIGRSTAGKRLLAKASAMDRIISRVDIAATSGVSKLGGRGDISSVIEEIEILKRTLD
ncbi:hypothetical protein ACLKMY_24835 [Paraburkholderia mimosarum]|uniref:hypothetical protein n=1 Tax=Paraburkholderia mimosarum TaxID=312026 RepID=UPI0039C08DA2